MADKSTLVYGEAIAEMSSLLIELVKHMEDNTITATTPEALATCVRARNWRERLEAELQDYPPEPA